ncbi:Rv3654c family TadE-like protein [Bifidobacterium oedipodis]|uniref:ABC-type oligopeptide transport system periplasmic component n=1 Tax=Bifidobacterium oedipodis TaxID=2675322 RepID=A0A7Y0HRW1_9BIFI|nr:Rv3654c family TadE-like protein [Bifidobacterium sp. DSM 109957]NMM93331.1 ABC-type oligopeptide transport system periplasmic component [Bifidobacterium sp. DSM 109957]
MSAQQWEEGSGTMAGAILVMVVGIMLAIVACAGNLLICQNRARSLADLIALQSATAFWQGDTADPCAFAAGLARANDIRLSGCEVNGDDVRLAVEVPTAVPIAPYVERTALAGPVECVKETIMSSNVLAAGGPSP